MELKYGRSKIQIDPKALGCHRILSAEEHRPADETEVIAAALENPIGTARLREIVQPQETVCIIVSDITRVYQNMRLFLPFIIRELEAAGVADRQVTLLCALGAHDVQTEEEKEQLLGSLKGRFRFIEHNCKDYAQLVHLGSSRHGTPICLSRYAVEADRVILTGAVTYHDMAGFGGGRKSVMPGIASYEGVSANHLHVFGKEPGSGLEPNCRLGNIEGNPMHEDMMDACSLLRPDFLFNVILDGNNQYYKAVAGDYQAAFEQGIRYCEEACSVPIKQKADIVIAGCGGYPKDMNLYQASKGYAVAIEAVKAGGTIILAANCEDGMGAPGSVKIITDCEDHLDREKKMRKAFEPEAYSGYYICEMARHYRLLLVSAYEPAQELNKSGIRLFSTMEEALESAYEGLGENPMTYVIPNSMSIVTKFNQQEG